MGYRLWSAGFQPALIIGLIGLVGFIGPIDNRAQAQENHGVQASLSTDTILLGDQIVLSVPCEDVTKNLFHVESEGGIEVLKEEYDTLQKTILTTLTCFEPGLHYVKLDADDSLPLMVLDVEVDTTTEEIRDIAGVEQVPYTFWEITRWGLLGLGVLSLAFGGGWLWKKWKSGKVAEWLSDEKPDTRTAEERALDKLEALRRKQLWQSGRTKEYYTELTDTVRIFIEESTGIRATEMTSEETMEEMENQKWNVDSSLLRDIFMIADLVKFAKGEPLPHEHQRSYDEAVAFVKALWECVKPMESKENESEGKEI